MPEVEIHPSVKKVLDKYKIVFKVIECRPDLADTAAFCEHYHYKLSQSANTILVASKKVDPVKYVAVVALATTKIDVNKRVCQLMGVRRASFAGADETIEQTGMMIGGVVAIGIENLPIYIDSAVMDQPEIVVGGGNRSSKLLLDPKELSKLPNVEVIERLAIPKEDLS